MDGADRDSDIGVCSPAMFRIVEKRGAEVMPFNHDQTTHVFPSLNDGGQQTVRAKDPANREQIALIQAHLKEEVEEFQRSDCSHPAKIHGKELPGLAELRAGAGQIDIHYMPLLDGAQIRFTAKEPRLVMGNGPRPGREAVSGYGAQLRGGGIMP
jgi:hypothetical protein